MTTSSPKANAHTELQLSYGYADGTYRLVQHVTLRDDGSGMIYTHGGLMSREEMLEFFVTGMKNVIPDRVFVLHGEEREYISEETLRGVLNGTITAKDLLIGS